MPNPACQQDMQEKVKSESTFFFFFLTGHQTLFSKICQQMKQLPHVQNIILGAVDDDCVYAGDDDDDNYDGNANCDYDQDYEC